MQRKSSIRWSQSDRAEIARMRKNFNAKITRLEKAGYDPALIPQRITAKQIYADIATRRDFTNLKKTVADFTTRGSEQIVEYKGQEMPRFEKQRVQRMVQSVQQQKAHRRKQLSKEKGNLTLAKETDLRALNTDRPRTAEEWKKFVYSLERQFTDKAQFENAVKYKQNYLKAIESVLGEKGKPLYDFINKQDPMKIAEGYTYDELTTIRFTYDRLNPEKITKAALETWKQFLNQSGKD